jgi:hypothetical protein
MKKIITLSILVASVFASKSQITIEPEEWLPCEEIKLIIDISQGTCSSLVGSDGPLYLWTWMPADPKIEGGNGQWQDSNEAMKLTKEGPDLWSYTMIPTEFYGVDAGVVYQNGFSLLVKADDPGSAGGCDELKSDDFTLAVAPPFTSAKIFALPKAVFQNDVFSFRYDNTLESKESMQDLDEVYVYASAFANGVEYPVSDMDNVGSNSDLKMTDMGDGQFVLTIIPDLFFPAVPAGATIDQLRFIVRKKDMTSDEDMVDEDAYFDIGCEAAGGGC